MNDHGGASGSLSLCVWDGSSRGNLPRTLTLPVTLALSSKRLTLARSRNYSVSRFGKAAVVVTVDGQQDIPSFTAMYPAKDAVHSGTGVFYQAMPAVGPDGKNIMKLIPVQMVNGHFVQPQTSQPRTASTPQKAVSIKLVSGPVHVVTKAALSPSVTQHVVRKQVSLMNVAHNQVGLDLGNSLNKHPLQQQTVHLMAKVPQMATPATNCVKSVVLPRQLPVTVKSPALPSGQYLQIPPNAQVQTFPASDLPAGIKKQIFTSSASSSPGSGLPRVVYVSPITTVTQAAPPPAASARHSPKLLSKAPDITCPSKGSKPLLKRIPKVSQSSHSPIKWVIEEEDSSTAPRTDPDISHTNYPPVTAESLWAVAGSENSNKHCAVIPNAASQSSRQGQDNALVVCNGKVYYLAKKCSLSLKMGKSDSPTAATKSNEFNKTIVPSSQKSLESVAAQMRQDLRVIVTDTADEVIDLCDDDAQDDSANASAVTHLDEDNVIFVSYIPPKSESTQKVMLKTQTALVKESDQTASDDRHEISAVGGQKPAARVCGSAGTNMHDTERSSINSRQSTSAQLELESMRVDVETGSPADPSTSNSGGGTCSPIEDTHNMESSIDLTTSRPFSSRQMDAHLLRQMFGITADVKLCLQRIDEDAARPVAAEPPQSEALRSVEDHQEPTSGLKEEEHFSQDLHSPQETDGYSGLVNVNRVKVQDQELSADPPAPSPHTDIGPLKCSHFKLSTKPLSASNSKSQSGQSSLKGTSCDTETEPVIGYVEPIDEDFLSTDENDIPNSQDAAARPQTQTVVGLSTNTRRMRRARKRTVCHCCIPGAQGPAAKSSAKSTEPEKECAWRAARTSNKRGRMKAVRKDIKLSGRISCLRAENQQSCKTRELPASDRFTAADSEVKRHEQIKRLQELLKEKEAALELVRNT